MTSPYESFMNPEADDTSSYVMDSSSYEKLLDTTARDVEMACKWAAEKPGARTITVYHNDRNQMRVNLRDDEVSNFILQITNSLQDLQPYLRPYDKKTESVQIPPVDIVAFRRLVVYVYANLDRLIISGSESGIRFKTKDLEASSLTELFNLLKIREVQLPTKQLERLDRQTRRRQKALARKQRGSANHRRAVNQVARTQQKARRVRSNAIHHLTSWIVRNHHIVGIETLAIVNMVKNPKLARAIQGQAWGQAASQLEYKAKLAGSQLVRADRWFPSSKRCSDCDKDIAELPLHVREWACPYCGVVHPRDRNAAENLRKVAQSHWETQNGCGGDVRPDGQAGNGEAIRRTPAKQQSESSPVKLASAEFAGSLE